MWMKIPTWGYPLTIQLPWIAIAQSAGTIEYADWSGVVVPDRVLSIGQIELKCVLTFNWIVRNRIVFGIGTAYLYKTALF